MVNKRIQMKTKKLKISSLHRPKNCKGQMKIQQTAFMLLAITVFFVLVGLFVLIFRVSSIKDTVEILEKDNAKLLVSKLANSPEFACGTAYGTLKSDCVDADKVMALKANINAYKNFWGVSNIEIRKIYPMGEGVICTTANYPNCDIIEVKTGEVYGVGVSNFISLCRKESIESYSYNKCELAELIVSYETVK